MANVLGKYGLVGLRDDERPGRPRRVTEDMLVALEKDLERAPNSARLLSARLLECTGLSVTFSTIKRWLKEQHWVWKRCRRSLKSKQNPQAFKEGQRVLDALQAKEMAGEIDLFYLDESGFSADACIPYVWQQPGKTLTLPANSSGHVNVIGLLSLQGTSFFRSIETTVTSTVITETMAEFIQSRPDDKLTVIVMGNAPIHRKAEREKSGTLVVGTCMGVVLATLLTRIESN